VSVAVNVRLDILSDVPVAAVDGDVDIANGETVRDLLLDGVRNGAPGLVVDLSATTYLDSHGIHLLLELARRLRVRQQGLRIVVPEHSFVRRLLILTSLDSEIFLDHTVGDAVTRLREA
jgi:anti-anti-sigma factor